MNLNLFNPKVAEYIQCILGDFANIPTKRKNELIELAAQLSEALKSKKRLNLIFVCTHNSRRSHFGQIWSSVLSTYYQLPFDSFSAGTVATRLNENALQAVLDAGIIMQNEQGLKSNPIYQFKYGNETPLISCFSKTINDTSLPSDDVVAIMTCSDASDYCPFVTGAFLRFPLTYEDPKVYDNTPPVHEKYTERMCQIATEIAFCFGQILL